MTIEPYNPLSDYINPDETERLLRAANILNQHVRATGLHPGQVTLSTHPAITIGDENRGLSRDHADAGIDLWLPANTATLLMWCEHLGAPSIRIRQRQLDTCLWADTAIADRVAWHLSGALSGWIPREVDVDWERSHAGRRTHRGLITVPNLRRALHLLGYQHADGTPVAEQR